MLILKMLNKKSQTNNYYSYTLFQVWFQNQRAKWRRSLLKQLTFGPHIVQECEKLFEISPNSKSNSELNYRNDDEETTIIHEEQSINGFANF